MRGPAWFLGAAIVVCSGQIGGQMPGPPAAPPVGTAEKPSEAMDNMLGMLEYQVTAVAKEMPADKYGFAPSAGLFAPGGAEKYDGVRTFGAQVTHLAQANYFFFAGWCGVKPDRDVKAIGDLKSKGEMLDALASSFAYAHKCVATITSENAFTAIKPVDGFSTRTTITAFCRGAWERSLWADGGIPADERTFAAGIEIGCRLHVGDAQTYT